MKSIVAYNTKRYIKESGYKQKAIAARAGYDPGVFSNMLNGRKLISDTDIPRIAAALNVTPNDLFATPE